MHYLIDSLENAANRLYHFLRLPANHEKIRSSIALVKKDYEAGVVGQTRHRGAALQTLLDSVGTENFFATLTAFFQEQGSGWKTTSANTNLVYQFLRMLPDFSVEYDDEFFNPVHPGAYFYSHYFELHHKRFSVLLIEQHQRVENNTVVPAPGYDHFQEQQRKNRQDELTQMQVTLAKEGKAILAKSIFQSIISGKKAEVNDEKTNALPAPKKLTENSEFAKARKAVKAMFLKPDIALAMNTDITPPPEDLSQSILFDDSIKGVKTSLVGLFGGGCRTMPEMVAVSHQQVRRVD